MCIRDSIKGGTALLIDNQLVIAISKNSGADDSKIKSLIKALLKCSDFTINFLKKLPKDPRHFTKIDYGKLKEMLS